MRKILTLLCAVFAGLWTSTANAETVQQQLDRLHAATDGTLVRLHAQRSPQRYLTHTTGEKVTMLVPENENDGTQLWILKPQGTGYTLQNTVTSKYLGIPNGSDKKTAPYASDDAVTLYIRANTVETSEEGKWVNISSLSDFSGNTTLNMNQDNKETVYNWSLDKGGIWTIEEPEEVLPALPEEGKTYYLRNLIYDRYVGEAVAGELVTTASISKSVFPVFTFEQAGEGFRIKNLVTGRYVAGASAQNAVYATTDKTGAVFVPTRVPHSAFFFKQEGKEYGMHVASSNSYKLVAWDNRGGQSELAASTLHPVPVEVTAEELAEMKQTYAAAQVMAGLTSASFGGLFANSQATQLADEYKSLSDADFLATPKVSTLPASVQEWLLKLKNDTWEPFEEHFRIHDYEAASNHDHWAGVVNITAFSPMYNPTGITLMNGETALIFVGEIPERASLRVEGHTSWQDHSGQKRTTLKEGFNVFTATDDYMQLYIDYKTTNGDLIADYPNIPIQIVGGKVNGFFDARNLTDAEWMEMKQAGLFTDPILDVVGHMVQWRVKAADVVDRLTRPVDVMKNWDRLIGLELNLMGLIACPDSLKAIGGEEVYEDYYPKKFNNRMLCFYNGNGGNPYSTYACTYYTSPDCFTDDGINPATFDLWTGGHEIGHNLQPAINLAACTEVSNNLFSGMVAHEFGKVGRSVSMNKLQERLASGNNLWLDNMGDVFHLNHMYYQLYLYYHAAGHNPLFWPKMFRLLRRDPLVNHNGKHVTADQDYLKFALKACEAAGEDLTEFFDVWGFFIPFDGEKEVSDYSATYISVTQRMINVTKRAMQKYPKANSALIFIDDFAEYNAGTRGTMDDYRSNLKKDYEFGDYLTFISKKPSQPNGFRASYSKSSGLFRTPTSAGGDIAGIKVYDADGKLIYIGNTRQMTIPASLRAQVASFKLSLPDGTDMPLYVSGDVDKNAVKMTVYSTAYPNGIVRYTNGADEAMLSDVRDGANALAVVESAKIDEAAPTMRASKNVIVKNGVETPVAANLELTDGEELLIPFAFQATSASYSRTGTGDAYNTVVLPFDMPKTAFGTGAIVEEVDRTEEVNGELTVFFKEMADDVVKAGHPVVVYNTADVQEWTPVLTQQTDVAVEPTVQTGETTVHLVGAYTQSVVGASAFKLNADGTAQAMSQTDTIEPFRAYLRFATEPGVTSVATVHVAPNLTGVESVEADVINDKAPIYDLLGRRITKPQPGRIYIQNGKKVMVRQ